MTISAVLTFDKEHKNIAPLVYDLHNYFSARKIEHNIIVIHSSKNSKVKDIISRLKSFAPHIISYQTKEPNSIKALQLATKRKAKEFILYFDTSSEIHIIELEKVITKERQADIFIGSCTHQKGLPRLKKLFSSDKPHQLLLFKKTLLNELPNAKLGALKTLLNRKSKKQENFTISCF